MEAFDVKSIVHSGNNNQTDARRVLRNQLCHIRIGSSSTFHAIFCLLHNGLIIHLTIYNYLITNGRTEVARWIIVITILSCLINTITSYLTEDFD